MSLTSAPVPSVQTPAPRRRRGMWRAGAVVVVMIAALAMPIGQASADVTFNQRMLELVNRERTANGLRALVSDATLAANAEDAPYDGCGFTVYGRAKDMGQRNYFSHTILGCATQSVFNILTSTGLVYSGAAENLAWMNGTTDPLIAAENLHNQLMGSSGHRANILNSTFTKIGIGSWRTSPGQTWSGGGSALPNVFVAAQLFAGGPVSTTTSTAPPTTSPTTVAPPVTVPGARFHPLTPSRLLDTRTGNGSPVGPLGPSSVMNLQVTGRGGVPSTGVSAVVLNVAVTGPTAMSHLTVYPAGEAVPLASNLNFVAGQTVPNLVTAKLGANGQLSIYNVAGNTHVIADVAGWYGL